MLYIVGLGLNPEGISKEGLEIVQRCKKVYLEKYTVDFPYSEAELEEKLEKKFVSVDRVFVENFEFIDEAKKQSVALLVYGSPLMLQLTLQF
jgi:diphthamide biosynthesis methyltransferase